jgi:SAM-dependent methyltransferase
MANVERYTPGYSAVAVQYMRRRHAGRDAAFFLPYLRPGMSILDCGCGPGTITTGLAKAVLPASVIGIDFDYSQVCLAKEAASTVSLRNIHTVTASVYALPFPDRTVDGVFAHALFEHLAEPLNGLREIRRVLRPGGVVGISSPDWRGVLIAPPNAAVQDTVHHFTDLQRGNGGNPYAGAELGKWLEAIGFVTTRLSARYDCYEDPGLIIHLMSERITGRAGSPHDRSRIIDEMVTQATMWARHPGALFAQAFVEAIAFAPA